MKRIFSVLALCTMLLCIMNVSYGADITQTTNSDQEQVDFATSNDVVITISSLSFVNDYSYEISDYGLQPIFSSPLSTDTLNAFDVDIYRDYICLDDYNLQAKNSLEPDKSVGTYPSNHVRKFSASIEHVRKE